MYNKIHYNPLHSSEQLNKLRIIQEHIPKNKSILDVGCGTGLSEILGNVMGIDPEIALLQQAKIPVIQGIGEHLPFKTNSFEVVICVTALHNFNNIKKGISEIKRVGKELYIFSILKRSKHHSTIKSFLNREFTIKRIIQEQRDTIYICQNQ